MVAPQNRYSTLMLYFKQNHVEESLDAIEPAIDIISHEEIVGRLYKIGITGNLPQI